jgi:hypothetical protein
VNYTANSHAAPTLTRRHPPSDGDAGLRAMPRPAAPEAEPIVDWFHIAMRWQHVHQLPLARCVRIIPPTRAL